MTRGGEGGKGGVRFRWFPPKTDRHGEVSSAISNDPKGPIGQKIHRMAW